MLKKFLVLAVVTMIWTLSGSPAAHADSLQGCGDCGGAIYTLTFNPTPVSHTLTTNTYAVSLKIDSSGYTGSSSAFVDAIALTLNLSGGGNVPFSSAVLVAAPGTAGDWNQPVFGGTNSGGCSASGTAFFCTDLKGAFETSSAPSKVGGTSTWTWDVTISSSHSLVTTALGDDLKVVYMTPPDNFDHVQVSDSIGLQTPGTPVPEPSSLALFGTGLLTLGALIRRKLSV